MVKISGTDKILLHLYYSSKILSVANTFIIYFTVTLTLYYSISCNEYSTFEWHP